ncbi:ATP-binding protein [Bacteroides helcogenes]|uniref:histidine kinase n=1 Tax=Bacteroides helcogenes (strain ATCC 35417 / DSM 20613 / JCM 6297 / CCUG 15421 / P 36-108) TaxID=693979 RepID=E6SWL8_BACT6|nr:ATP-binding protein [Bacteroides helcogenes]ADV42616.1 integral membrane sensor signal transduction histidine kinase [Bacteroides helcogenes P 36-108]MDY5237622.1 ATP-binding protein [Bacteroides helcogenes]
MPTRKTTYCFTFYLIFFLLLAGHTISLSGQNNPYKIKDSLYALYQRAGKQSDTKLCIALADTLYRAALAAGDKKAQCMARILPVQRYFSLPDKEAEMAEAVERLKEVSRANGYLQYYYYGWNQKIAQLLNNAHSVRALEEAEQMRKQAFEDNHPYGIYLCIREMANIQLARGNFMLSNRYNLDALDYLLKNLPEQDPAPLYTSISEYYRGQGRDYPKALDYCEQGIKSAKTGYNLSECLIQKCQVLFEMGRFNDFNTCYDEAMQQIARSEYPSERALLLLLKLKKCVLDGDFEGAHKYADRMLTRMDATRQHAYVYYEQGDYRSAYHTLRRAQVIADSIRQVTRASEIAEFNALVGNEQLKLENSQLDLKNSRLDLKNADLLLEQVRQQMELERRNAENNQLILDNRELDVQRLKGEAALQQSKAQQQALLLKQQQEASHYRIIIFCTVIFSMAVFIAFLVYHLIRRRHHVRQLEKKNLELSVARDQAQSANRMKSIFIQNMSHEIRTPLNSIVGFSQLIANPDMELEPEEQQEYSELIVSNSELLTTLVNDLLGLAELESGKYVTKLVSQRCNELCSQSVATTIHRKPESVKLYYTSDVPDDYEILTDGQRVRQVLINFLTNAEKHTERGEIHLHCSLTEMPGCVTFSVTDTGTGIPAEQAEHIFGRFEKLNAFDQGFGLGLSICRLIADYLGAVVKLDTSYKDGARFLFILPVSPPNLPERKE